MKKNNDGHDVDNSDNADDDNDDDNDYDQDDDNDNWVNWKLLAFQTG